MAENFEEIWEQDAKWIMGRHILGVIVEYLRGRSLGAAIDAYSSVGITIPLPEYTDDISGKNASIYFMIPPELRDLFIDKCNDIIEVRRPILLSIAEKYLQNPLNATTIAMMNAELHQVERGIQCRGELELWQIAAEKFGLTDWMIRAPQITFK